ncbi:MAG: hypothetical protein AMXMBFR58_30880 [Phycisphaerae bacterium]
MGRVVIAAFEAEFRRYRDLADRAAAQLGWDDLREPLHPEVNSIAVVMKHVAGNLRSRWSDPFTTDGEKPWRNRDREFVDDLPDRDALDEQWRGGWGTVEAVLAACSDLDLDRTLMIRGEAHTLALALARSLSHTAYHCGQIVQTARALAGRKNAPWRTLTVPRGGSVEFNASKGFDPGAPSSGGRAV